MDLFGYKNGGVYQYGLRHSHNIYILIYIHLIKFLEDKYIFPKIFNVLNKSEFQKQL